MSKVDSALEIDVSKIAFTLLLSFFSSCAFGQGPSPLQTYDAVVDITTKHFYDQTFRGLNWGRLTSEYRQKLNDTSTPNEIQQVINALLANLNASHTEFLTINDQEYHGLQSIFSQRIEGDQYYQCGGWYQKINENWFVKNVFSNSPMERAGIVSGDEIIDVDGKPFAPVQSCDTASPVILHYRHRQFGAQSAVRLIPEKKSAQELLLESTIYSKKIRLLRDKRVGYFHLWSGTHDQFLESIQAVTREMENTTDMMILDLRDGFGGAWTPYIQPFFDKDLDTGTPVAHIYSKPVYVLINDGVRSGKEYLAYLIKKKDRGLLIGTNTAGHVLGGKLFNITDGLYSLFLAVAKDPTGVLEGRGVAPDVRITSTLPFSAGRDVQLEATLELIRQR